MTATRKQGFLKAATLCRGFQGNDFLDATALCCACGNAFFHISLRRVANFVSAQGRERNHLRDSKDMYFLTESLGPLGEYS